MDSAKAHLCCTMYFSSSFHTTVNQTMNSTLRLIRPFGTGGDHKCLLWSMIWIVCCCSLTFHVHDSVLHLRSNEPEGVSVFIQRCSDRPVSPQDSCIHRWWQAYAIFNDMEIKQTNILTSKASFWISQIINISNCLLFMCVFLKKMY